MDNWLGWFGGAAIFTALFSVWGHFKEFFNRIISYVIVSVQYQSLLGDAIIPYIYANMVESRFNSKTYKGWLFFVRPTNQVEMVAVEGLGTEVRVFWNGWFPIFLNRTSDSKGSDSSIGSWSPVKLTFLRGTLDTNKLAIEAAKFYNTNKRQINKLSGNTRHQIHYIFGTSGKPAQMGCLVRTSDEIHDYKELIDHRVLGWTINDLGQNSTQNSIDKLALEDNTNQLVQDIQQWVDGKSWYESRGIPWKMGTLLYGEPGVGKTALIRGIAEKCDLPIYVFDLFSLYNDELRSEWKDMLSNTPCIALFEDIDSVFNKRESSNKQLSFDCLLNCIDGVEKSDGVLVFVTTNNIDKVDVAIGGHDGYSTRPGRIDRVIEMKRLTKDGRLKLAQRILKDWPEVWEETVGDSDTYTGAQFENLCIEKANKMYWGQEC